MIFEKRDNKDHRIALKKRLERAYKKMGVISTSADLEQAATTSTTTAAARKHQNRRPDPVKPHLAAAHKDQLAASEKIRSREAAAKERQTMLEKSKERRAAQKSVHVSRTTRGQPKLSAQIGLLLSKIEGGRR
jgi:hypothetical protein